MGETAANRGRGWRAKPAGGDGQMHRSYALTQSEVEEGYSPDLSAHPTTDALKVDYDA